MQRHNKCLNRLSCCLHINDNNITGTLDLPTPLALDLSFFCNDGDGDDNDDDDLQAALALSMQPQSTTTDDKGDNDINGMNIYIQQINK